MDQYSASHAKEVRMNDIHVFFWGSVLSNWYKGGNFSGENGLRKAVKRLQKTDQGQEAGIVIPAPNQRSSQEILKHSSSCGEHFMMPCKAWLFNTDTNAAVLRAILASQKPANQKALGYKVPGFDQTKWEIASFEIVIASQLARAEVDKDLATWYRSSGTKRFVEGSPYDNIWGLGYAGIARKLRIRGSGGVGTNRGVSLQDKSSIPGTGEGKMG